MLSASTPLGADATLREKAARLVKHELLSGTFRAGSILSANALSKELGISNSPMREALMDLAAQGLLEVVKNRGFRVRSMSQADFLEVREMRSILEVAAIERLAVRGLSGAEESRARELCEQSLAPLDEGDPATFLDADRAMHMHLVSLLGNARLSDAIGNLRDQTRICGAYLSTSLAELEACAGEHVDLIDAVVARDAPRAAAVMRAHLEYATIPPTAGTPASAGPEGTAE